MTWQEVILGLGTTAINAFFLYLARKQAMTSGRHAENAKNSADVAIKASLKPRRSEFDLPPEEKDG